MKKALRLTLIFAIFEVLIFGTLWILGILSPEESLRFLGMGLGVIFLLGLGLTLIFQVMGPKPPTSKMSQSENSKSGPQF